MGNDELIIVNRNIAGKKAVPGGNLFYSSSAGEAAGRLLEQRPGVIGFVGGDGTVSATLNKVLEAEPSFLEGRMVRIIPGGSGNDRIKSLKQIFRTTIHSSGAANVPLPQVTEDYLLATINGQYRKFIFNVGGIGLDSQTLMEYDQLRTSKIPASLKYFGAATSAIHRLNGYKGKVMYSIGGNPGATAEPVMFLFMLGKYFGGGMPINSRLVNNDGLFESVILNRGTNMKLYSSLVAISLLKQPQYHNPIVRYLDPSHKAELQVLSADKFYFESDGEVLTDNGEPVEVKRLTVEVAGKINYLMLPGWRR